MTGRSVYSTYRYQYVEYGRPDLGRGAVDLRHRDSGRSILLSGRDAHHLRAYLLLQISANAGSIERALSLTWAAYAHLAAASPAANTGRY